MGRWLTILYYVALGPATIGGACAALAGLSIRGSLTIFDLIAGGAYVCLLIAGVLFTYFGVIEVQSRAA